MKKIAVVTARVGVGDSPPELYDIEYDSADYFYFTDVPDCVLPEGWNERLLYPCSIDKRFENRRSAKIPKQLAHLVLPEYDYYIWHDRGHVMGKDPEELIKYVEDVDMALFKHPQRDNWLDEVGACRHRDHSSRIEQTVTFLEEIGIPGDALYEMSAFIRKNNAAANRCFGLWAELVTLCSSRDQLTFPAAVHLTQPKINILPGTALAYGGNNDLLPHNGSSFASSFGGG